MQPPYKTSHVKHCDLMMMMMMIVMMMLIMMMINPPCAACFLDFILCLVSLQMAFTIILLCLLLFYLLFKDMYYNCFLLTAADGELLLGLPKVKVLRNDRREGIYNVFKIL